MVSGQWCSAGRWFSAGTGWWEELPEPSHLVLPTICYTYAQLAFLSRMTRVSTLEIYGQDFIRTARAKGLSARTVLYRHAFRNASCPSSPYLPMYFLQPLAGRSYWKPYSAYQEWAEIVQAIYQQDYPVIVAVFTLTGVLTLAGYLLADILYSVADPRITWKDEQQSEPCFLEAIPPQQTGHGCTLVLSVMLLLALMAPAG